MTDENVIVEIDGNQIIRVEKHIYWDTKINKINKNKQQKSLEEFG